MQYNCLPLPRDYVGKMEYADDEGKISYTCSYKSAPDRRHGASTSCAKEEEAHLANSSRSLRTREQKKKNASSREFSANLRSLFALSSRAFCEHAATFSSPRAPCLRARVLAGPRRGMACHAMSRERYAG